MTALTVLFEGVDGAGKTSLIRQVKATAELAGLRVASLQDPGATNLGIAIRNWLQVNDRTEPGETHQIDRVARFLLYQASRVQAERELLLPAIENCDLVLMDRWVPSTVVYQHLVGNLPWEMVEAVVESTCSYLQFDIALYLRVSALTAAKRERDRKQRFGPPASADLNLSTRLVNAYEQIVSGGGGWQGYNWRYVDGEQRQDAVHEQVFEIIVNALEGHILVP